MERNAQICRGSLSSIQLTTEQCLHVEELLEIGGKHPPPN